MLAMLRIPQTATVGDREKLQKFAELFAGALDCLGQEFISGPNSTFIAGFADAIELAFDMVDTLNQDDTFLLLDCMGEIQAALTTRQRQAIDWHLKHDMELAMRRACRAIGKVQP
jgi:hypothetical protein